MELSKFFSRSFSGSIPRGVAGDHRESPLQALVGAGLSAVSVPALKSYISGDVDASLSAA